MSLLTDVDISHPLVVGIAAAAIVAAATLASSSPAAVSAVGTTIPPGTLLGDILTALRDMNTRLVPTSIVVGIAAFIAAIASHRLLLPSSSSKRSAVA